MRTRSQSREQRPPPPEEPPVVIEPLRIEYPFQEDPPVEPMADTRTMAQLLQVLQAPPRGTVQPLMTTIIDNILSMCHQAAAANYNQVTPISTSNGFKSILDLQFSTRSDSSNNAKKFHRGNNINQNRESNFNHNRGPPIPTSSVENPIPQRLRTKCNPFLLTKYRTQSNLPVGPNQSQLQFFEPIVAPVVAPRAIHKPSVSPSISFRRDNEKSRNQANEQIDKFYEIFKEMSFEISFTDALVLMPKFASTLRTLLGNKEKLTEVARTSNEPCLARTSMNEHCSAVILNKYPEKHETPAIPDSL
ncbi:hypothetical protein Tco_0487065 [Tanacetum coccineum]